MKTYKITKTNEEMKSILVLEILIEFELKSNNDKQAARTRLFGIMEKELHFRVPREWQEWKFNILLNMGYFTTSRYRIEYDRINKIEIYEVMPECTHYDVEEV